MIGTWLAGALASLNATVCLTLAVIAAESGAPHHLTAIFTALASANAVVAVRAIMRGTP